MKKKAKLFTTIASLCMAVALMAFGVYAATSVGFTASSKVTFAASEIMGYYTLEIEGGDYTGEKTYVKGNTQKIAVADADANGTPVTQEVTIEDIALTAAAKATTTVTYTIKFYATGEVMADVTVTATPKATVAGYSVAVDKTEKQTTAAKDEPVTFVITLTLNTAAEGFNAAAASDFTFDIAANAVPKA